MQEKELIKKIQLLKKIKPRKDWVVLTKTQILGEEKAYSISGIELLRFRPVYAGLLFIFIILGLFGVSLSSLPGEPLYSVKKIAEQSQALFVSEEKLPSYTLEMANKRLEELTKIAKANEVKKLAPAFSEFQAEVSEAAKVLQKSEKVNVKEIVEKTKKLEQNKEIVEYILATKIETKELDNALSSLVEREINDLESSILTEEQANLLIEAKAAFEEGNYNLALEKILQITNF